MADACDKCGCTPCCCGPKKAITADYSMPTVRVVTTKGSKSSSTVK